MISSFAFSLGNTTLYSRAEGSFYEEDLETAFKLFNEYLQNDPTHIKARYHAEICSLLTYYPTKSLDQLFEFEATVGARDKFYQYWLGRIYASRYDFKSALTAWEKFLNQKAYKSKVIVEETRRFMAQAEARQLYVLNGSPFRVHQLPDEVNTSHSEVSPVILSSEGKMLVTRITEDGKRSVRSELLTFERTGTNTWSENMTEGKFNNVDKHLVVIQSVMNDTRVLLAGGKKKTSLFTADWEGGQWSNPVEIEFSGEQQNGFLSEDGQTLYFSASSTDGTSQTDLFFSQQQPDGLWATPVPVKELNTLMDESSPFLSPDGATLYFSSTGYGGMGGYDVLKSVYNALEGRWGDPTNVGFPLNTPADELFFKLNPDGRTGYLASNRVGARGLLDVYFFMEEIRLSLRGRVLASGANKPVSGIGVRVVVIDDRQNATTVSTDTEGFFDANILAGVKNTIEFYLEETLLKTETIELPYSHASGSVLEKSFEVDIPQDLAGGLLALEDHVDTRVISEYTELEDLGKKFSKGNKAVLDNIYFEPGSDYISSEYSHQLAALCELLRNNPDLTVEIGGYTDSKEEDSGQKNLSLLRARSVGSYLIQRKIDYRRLREVGYSNRNLPSANVTNRSENNLNRRIEVLVIE